MSSPTTNMIDAVPSLLLAVDAGDKIALWSRRLEEVTGFSRAERLGQPSEALIGGDAPRPLLVKDGRQRLVRWECAALPSPLPSGLPSEESWTYYVGTDITDEHEVLARRMRGDRLAAVGTFAAGLAHEIRNPLNSALLQLTVLQRRLERSDMPVESLRPVAAAVDQELRRLERLVNDFIAFAQPRPLVLRPTELASLCRTIAAAIGGEAEAAGIHLTLELPNGLPLLEADPERLQQVLLNLARNAMEAMTRGGELTLRLRRAAGTLEIDVADTGSGFSDDAPVFDAFFTTKPNGTGLGLSIVHRIVADHGGTVSVRSRPGNTCFTIALPDRVP